MNAVFLAVPFSPYAEVTEAENLEKARNFAVFALQRGCVPIVPALLCDLFRRAIPETRHARDLELFALEAGLGLAETAGKTQAPIWVLLRNDGTVSPGCSGEISAYEKAFRKHFPAPRIRYFDANFKEIPVKNDPR